ncbi:MAG: hypothetical protein HC883_00050 [Bdellovibrionaceae bacterium]|nr:hypothetical protein [Pseudobdellovibrionaceae bacterium]
MDAKAKRELLELIEEKERRAAGRKLYAYYPDQGPLRRELYRKHTAFFAAGAKYRERCMMAANRVGKTEGVGAFEVTCHLTGEYPKWWEGRRFNRPVSGRAAGDTSKTVRDIIQKKLLGKFDSLGTGLIPRELLVKTTRKTGISEAIDSIYVRHASGGTSQLTLKSYEEGRESFQGDEQDLTWLDEEPPLDIYVECLLRTMTVDGIVISTFTPLAGLSETVLSFLPGGEIKPLIEGEKFLIMATWDDAPHLTRAQKDELWAAIPPYQREARAKGIPQLGSGAIYPIPESDIIIPDIQIPEHWTRGLSMDVGWKRTSVGLWALDKDNDILYRTGEHYRGEEPPRPTTTP